MGGRYSICANTGTFATPSPQCLTITEGVSNGQFPCTYNLLMTCSFLTRLTSSKPETSTVLYKYMLLSNLLTLQHLEWYMRNVKRHDRPIKTWSLESVFKGVQKCLLNTLMRRQASNKFNTIKQGKPMVQELIHDLTKYAAPMVQYLDNYLFKRCLLSTLRPSLQKEFLCRGVTAEFSSIQEILEKAKDVEDSFQYDIGSRMV